MAQSSDPDAAAPDERPLAGVRVLAVENFVAAPFATMWFADAGAEVVKIEHPEHGDLSRGTNPRRADADGVEHGLAFLRTNRNKQSLTLDLKSEEGRRLFCALAAQADVVVENLRAGAMDKLGLGWTTLQALNPRLIYVAISGFGHEDTGASPYTHYPAFDIVGQAMSGLMYRPERPDERPVYLGFSLSDIHTGIVAGQGALMALFQRERTGKGQKVDVSLYDASLVLNEISVAMYSVFQRRPASGLHGVTAPFGAYRTRDGFIVIAVVGEPIWRRFCAAIGQPGLVDDERFADGMSRHANLAALNVAIEPWLAARTRTEAVEALIAGGVPAALVNEVDDVFTCPHVAAHDMLVEFDDPVWGGVSVPANPIRMSGSAAPRRDLPPRLGEHTATVLARWLDMSEEEVAALKERGIV